MKRYVIAFRTVRHDTVAAETPEDAARIVRAQLKPDEGVLAVYELGAELPGELEASKYHLPGKVV